MSTTDDHPQTEPRPDASGEFDDLFARIEADIERERGLAARLRALPRWLAIALAVGLILLFAALWLWLWPRSDMHLYPDWRLLLELAALAALSISAVHTFLSSPRLCPTHEPLIALRLLGHLIVALAIVFMPPAHLTEPYLSAGTGSMLWPCATACLSIGTSAALPVLGLILLLDRGSAMQVPLTRMLAPAGAWLGGMLVLQLHCPILAHEHQLLGHAGVLVPVLAVWALIEGLRRARSESV